jgi:hypothetical protein
MNNPGQLVALTISMMGVARMLSAAESQPLPWQREISLREAAQSVVLENTLNPTNPNGRPTMSINNLKMHTVLWGLPNQITISLTKIMSGIAASMNFKRRRWRK